MMAANFTPGKVALIGSGETAATGGKVFEVLARSQSVPLRVAVMETPAGFELNAEQVAGRVSSYLQSRLQNYAPVLNQIPARKRGTIQSPDNAEILQPLLTSELIFMGPGSPSYAVRQLRGSLAWKMIHARLLSGAAVAFASAATVAAGCCAIPVYEIYKVGEDPYWNPGLDLLGPFGLRLAVVPHWNNSDGGAELDTSHCFIGTPRFELLRADLDPEVTILGIDEHTGLVLDLQEQTCEVLGVGAVHITPPDGVQTDYPAGSRFAIQALGSFCLPELAQTGVDAQIWAEMQQALAELAAATPEIPAEVQSLVDARQQARADKDWPRSDHLRDELAALGWRVLDTPQGAVVERL